MITLALLAHLLGAAAFADGMDQGDAERIRHGEQAGSDQKLIGPVLMHPQQAQQPPAIGQMRNQVILLAKSVPPAVASAA
jgi:hypothetical protein